MAEFDQASLDDASLVLEEGLLLVRAEAATHTQTAQPRFVVKALNLSETLTQLLNLVVRTSHTDSVARPVARQEGAASA